eukprot:4701235-Pyramimonas_sp.AAC.1
MDGWMDEGGAGRRSRRRRKLRASRKASGLLEASWSVFGVSWRPSGRLPSAVRAPNAFRPTRPGWRVHAGGPHDLWLSTFDEQSQRRCSWVPRPLGGFLQRGQEFVHAAVPSGQTDAF